VGGGGGWWLCGVVFFLFLGLFFLFLFFLFFVSWFFPFFAFLSPSLSSPCYPPPLRPVSFRSFFLPRPPSIQPGRRPAPPTTSWPRSIFRGTPPRRPVYVHPRARKNGPRSGQTPPPAARRWRDIPFRVQSSRAFPVLVGCGRTIYPLSFCGGGVLWWWCRPGPQNPGGDSTGRWT